MKVAFDGFLFDRPARRLTRDGRDVHLSPKAFDLLALLIERRPDVVDKAAIRTTLWPGVHVVDASLTNLVTEIRGACGREAGARILRTVHGVGYAFGSEASDVAGEPAPDGDGAPAGSCWVELDGRQMRLVAGENIVGREARAHVQVESTTVSRRHAVIRVPGGLEAGSVTLEDLGSTNGTAVRGRRVRGVVRLEHGDKVRVGDVTLVFHARSVADAPTRRVGSKG